MQKENQTENKKTVLLDTKTAIIVYDIAEKEGISPEEALSRIVRTYLDKLKKTEPIEFEQVTIKVPKRIMAFLRFQAGYRDVQVEEEIEYDLLDNVRAEMEGLNGEELISMLEVGRIFYDILGDERYNPKPKTTE
jgi:hypothetical protein